MRFFEVGFEVGDGIFSVNTIWANTGREELEAATETAERRAALHGYAVAYVKEITEAEAEVANRKGRPMYSIDDEAERAHDPSFSEEAEESAPEEPTEAEADAPELYVTEADMAEWMDEIEKELNREFADDLLEIILAGIIQERPELAVKLDNIGKLSLIARQAYLIGFNRALHEVHGVQDVLLRERAERRAAL